MAPISGIFCCGSICRDIVVRPVRADVWGSSQWVEQIGESIGGHGANTAIALARMETPVRLIGMTGGDAAGETLRSALEAAGVDLASIRRARAATTTSVALVQASGERSFLHYPGASAEVTAEYVLSELDGMPYSHFHLATFFAFPRLRYEAASLLAAARIKGLSTSLDPGWDALGRWFHDLEPALPEVDLLLLNESEAERLTGEAAPEKAIEHLRRHGVRDVLIKRGAGGCIVFAGDRRWDASGFPVDAIDSTGAGDCFAGGLLAALHRNLSYPEAAVVANAAGALSVGQLGATTGLLSWAGTQRWIHKRQIARP